MDTVFPELLLMYLGLFRESFSSSSYAQGVCMAGRSFMLLSGRKRVTGIACFFLNKHVSSFERSSPRAHKGACIRLLRNITATDPVRGPAHGTQIINPRPQPQ